MTIRTCCHTMDRFFDWLGEWGIALDAVVVADIDRAVMRWHARGCSRSTIRVYGQRLRTFFRFAERQGWCPPGLADGIMPVRFPPGETFPKGLNRGEVLRLLATSEGNRQADLRDRAILMVLIAYGLRASEVAGLRLDDPDWEEETLRVRRPKSGCTHHYPLSRGGGQAIVRYLTEVRALRPERALFLTLIAPIRPVTRQAVSNVVRTRLDRLSIKELLEVPDRRTPRGRVEHALLLFLYNTGARVSETTQLVAGDLQIGRRGGGQALVNIHGKGGKHRQCPLWPRTEAALTELLQGRAAGDAVFLSRQRRSYTRFGVYRLVERSAARVPSLAGRRGYTSHHPSHQRLPPAPSRHRSEHYPRLARSCQPRYDQYLRRDRHGDEGQGHGALRCRRARIGSPVEGKHGTDRLPGRALSEGDYVAEIRRVLMCSRMIRTVRHIIRTATYGRHRLTKTHKRNRQRVGSKGQ